MSLIDGGANKEAIETRVSCG